MGAIRKEIINIVALFEGSPQRVRVKLDAWRCTLVIRNAGGRFITIDGIDLGWLSWPDGTGASQPTVIPMGGMVLNGKPVQMDDELIITSTNNAGVPQQLVNMYLVKEYYISDTPGPDRLFPEPNERTRDHSRQGQRRPDTGGQHSGPRDRPRARSDRRER